MKDKPILYRKPLKVEFVRGFKYERTDGGDWYNKTYDKFQEGDVALLIPQDRIRVKVDYKLISMDDINDIVDEPKR